MALVDKLSKSGTKETPQVPELSVQEYEFLFSLIKNSTFKGDQLEFLYNVILKLQTQYLKVKESE
jgi:hypothetical protein